MPEISDLGDTWLDGKISKRSCDRKIAIIKFCDNHAMFISREDRRSPGDREKTIADHDCDQKIGDWSCLVNCTVNYYPFPLKL